VFISNAFVFISKAFVFISKAFVFISKAFMFISKAFMFVSTMFEFTSSRTVLVSKAFEFASTTFEFANSMNEFQNWEDNSRKLELLRGGPVLNARSYQPQMSADGGKTRLDMGEFNGARRIVLQPVTPGTVYTAQFRALGGSTKYSAWSDSVSHIAT
jgi:hypothetical protein